MSYQMRLTDLLPQAGADAAADRVITGMGLDSRTVTTGQLFFALANDDKINAQHIEQAVAAGVAAVCVDISATLPAPLVKQLADTDIALLKLENLAANLSRLAAAFYREPSAEMTIMAVTGTNGKTSVSHFIAQALENAGHACGVIGTLGSGRLGQLKHNGMTTPDPVSLQAMLATMRDTGIKYVVLEASSHALQQGRLNSVAIDYALFTNLSRDHLDYHQSMAEYAVAKQQLFHFESLQAAVINIDDAFGRELLPLLDKKQLKTLKYSCQQAGAELSASQIQANPRGLQFDLKGLQHTYPISSRLLGRFNVENMLATAAMLTLLGWSEALVAQSLGQLDSVDGRMKLLAYDAPPSVVIDFAHTPDALQKALQGMRQHLNDASQLWCVFGCGGERDTGKRPLMGKIASELADHIVVTEDNPRGEDSKRIIEQILAGCQLDAQLYIEADRQQAIEHAVLTASLQDMVLIAGKGHEQYQEKCGIKVPFNDYEIAMQAIQKRYSATEVTL